MESAAKEGKGREADSIPEQSSGKRSGQVKSRLEFEIITELRGRRRAEVTNMRNLRTGAEPGHQPAGKARRKDRLRDKIDDK